MISYRREFVKLTVLSSQTECQNTADLRTDDAQSASPDSEQIEPAGA